MDVFSTIFARLTLGFVSSVPVWAFIPACWTTTPAADFCRPVRVNRSTLSRTFYDQRQTSRGKFNRLLRTTAEFTFCALDGYGLRDHWPARPALTPLIRFLYIGSRICSTLLSNAAFTLRT